MEEWMKKRIVCPSLWFDEKFASISVEAKLLFMYLITNDQLTLTRYHHISDRQILFDTGLTINQLKTSKKELEKLHWCFFSEGWIYHNHNCAYVDYFGQPKVMIAKEKELEIIPDKIKGVFNGFLTPYQPNRNQKLETRNQKPEIKNQKRVEEIKKQIRKRFRVKHEK